MAITHKFSDVSTAAADFLELTSALHGVSPWRVVSYHSHGSTTGALLANSSGEKTAGVKMASNIDLHTL